MLADRLRWVYQVDIPVEIPAGGTWVYYPSHGYAMGGYNFNTGNPSFEIDGFVFATYAAVNPACALQLARSAAAGCNSELNGYTMCGQNIVDGEVDGFVFLTLTAINPAAMLSPRGGFLASFNSKTTGYVAGGWNPYSSEIRGFVFLTDTVADITSVMSEQISDNAGCDSLTHGYSMGGWGSPVAQKYNFSTTTVSTFSFAMSASNGDGAGCNSSIAGYFMGGYDNNNLNTTITGFDFATETEFTVGCVLSNQMTDTAGTDSSTKGFAMGGSWYLYENKIRGFAFSTQTQANPSSVLSASRYMLAGCTGYSRWLRGFGYVMCGYFGTSSFSTGTSNLISALQYFNEAYSYLSASLSSRGYLAGCNSSDEGYTMGGGTVNGATDAIYGFSYATKFSFTLSTTLTINRAFVSGCNSSTAGYVFGGRATAYYVPPGVYEYRPGDMSFSVTNDIEGFIFSNQAKVDPVCALNNYLSHTSACESATDGYCVGGKVTNSDVAVNSVQKFSFSAETCNNIANNLAISICSTAICTSETHGYVMGGGVFSDYYLVSVSDICSFNFSTEATAVVNGYLTMPKHHTSGCSSSSKGYVMGGYSSLSPYSTHYLDDIESFIFETSATTIIAAKLVNAFSATASCEG